MSITSAMYTGISGLNANGEAISVLGNNISNVNTIGFKNGRMLFSDVLSSSIGNNSQIGRGVQIQAVQNNFSQGSFENTENVTDLAIQGESFFIVKNPGEAQRYTRAGAFNFDKNKILVNPDGLQLQGYGINQTTGLNNGSLGAIDLTNFSTLPPKMTTTLTTRVNLDSTQTIPGGIANTLTIGGNLNSTTGTNTVNTTMVDNSGTSRAVTLTFTQTAANAWSWSADIAGATPATASATGAFTIPATTIATSATINGNAQALTIDLTGVTEAAAGVATVATANAATTAFSTTDPVGTSNFSNSMTVYDSQGNPHSVTTYYRKTGVNSWDWHANVQDGTPAWVDGTMTFNTAGILTAQTPAATAAQNITFSGVTAPQPLLFDFGVNASTQFASASIVNSQNQDGYYQGSLSKVQVDEKGYVIGVYSNGQSQKLAQVALARFASTNGLSKVGSTLFEETLASGQALISDASTPGVGKILSNSLEQSNVDMAAQFVKLIQAQRAFSANSKTITTADEMTQELLNLKR
ncbi:flagellar hook protein FlgE [Geobacter sp. OR-1]|uniref:flagellar hook protein FlgE n=1 Tax=Geobacter sp. OR-1 TaxID=1266765 RepID=UPI00054338CC|nr:flagellar hook protein FlgE [Geobacter sp. OR-1]GAM09690.1 flagellar hook protein FlgE [Geobacter sp. OR-1]